MDGMLGGEPSVSGSGSNRIPPRERIGKRPNGGSCLIRFETKFKLGCGRERESPLWNCWPRSDQTTEFLEQAALSCRHRAPKLQYGFLGCANRRRGDRAANVTDCRSVSWGFDSLPRHVPIASRLRQVGYSDGRLASRRTRSYNVRPLMCFGAAMRYYASILETIGNTPLVQLPKIMDGVKGLVLAKLEMMNPGGSVKDRIGEKMIEDAEAKGALRPGGTIIEPTSGNTGLGLAMVAASKGYRAVFTMPDKMSREKIDLLKAIGARVVVTPTAVPPDHPESYYRVAERIHRETPNSILPNQYAN